MNYFYPFSCFANRYTLDEFGTARRSAVVRGFIDALTRGGLGGTPRPIEMHSHDPLRYCTENVLGIILLLPVHTLNPSHCKPLIHAEMSVFI